MEDYKWTRGLSEAAVSNVLSQQPRSVTFDVDYKRHSVTCLIERVGERALGTAICSCLDEFDVKKGKMMAANRAVTALIEQDSSSRVRYQWESFPKSWTKKRIEHLRSFSGMNKCAYSEI